MSNNGVVYKCFSTELLNILNTFTHFLCVCIGQRATCRSQCPSVGSRSGTQDIRYGGTFSFGIYFLLLSIRWRRDLAHVCGVRATLLL